MKLSGKRIAITGSSRGLGRAFAIACAAEGAQVVLNGTNKDALAEVEHTIKSAGGDVVSYAGSVAEEEICAGLVSKCVETFGGIDTIVHNAGVVRDRTIMKMTAEEFDEVVAVHLRGAFLCTKYAALAMKETGGHIILITSGSGLVGGFGQSNYAAAKEGMMGLLRSAVLELTKFNIRCNAMWPVADTDMTQVVFDRAKSMADQKGETAPTPAQLGFGQPEEVAQGIVWLASNAANHLNGQCLSFNGHRTALWRHPSEAYVHFSDDPMTAEQLDAHFKDKDPLTFGRPKMVKG